MLAEGQLGEADAFAKAPNLCRLDSFLEKIVVGLRPDPFPL